jgi:hypothetical protein
LPVCPQLPNIFHFLLYFLQISISLLVVFIFLLKYSKWSQFCLFCCLSYFWQFAALHRASSLLYNSNP